LSIATRFLLFIGLWKDDCIEVRVRQYFRTMSEMVGPDGNAPSFDGAAWISQDGRYWWNGAAWQPIKRRGFRPPIAVAGIVLVIVAGAWFVLKSLPQPPPPQNGVSNTKIDSPTQFEFDYRRATTCNDITFLYTFFDSGGHAVGTYPDQQHNKMIGGRSYHVTVNAFGVSIDPHAVRFDAAPTCHD
jgi:hypothetical protein